MKKLLKFKNIMDLLDAFPTEQACVQYLIKVRHNGKMDCPHCSNSKVYAFKDGKTKNTLDAFLKLDIKEVTNKKGV